MKVTMATTAIKGNDGSRTFVLCQSPTEQMLKIKKFEAGVAEVVFLDQKEQSLKSQLKILAGCFETRSNVEASLQYFFETRQSLKKIQLLFDGVELVISKDNRDVVKLCRQWNKLKVEKEWQSKLIREAGRNRRKKWSMKWKRQNNAFSRKLTRKV